VRLSILDPVRLMHLRHESRATFDTCTYLAGFWTSKVLGFATDDTVISPFGVAIPLVLLSLAIGPDFSLFHVSIWYMKDRFHRDAYVEIIAHWPEGSLNLHTANSMSI
jgi:hypothetical protein